MRILHLLITLQMAAVANGLANLKLGALNFLASMWVQEPKDLTYHLLLSQDVGRELDQKWNIRDFTGKLICKPLCQPQMIDF